MEYSAGALDLEPKLPRIKRHGTVCKFSDPRGSHPPPHPYGAPIIGTATTSKQFEGIDPRPPPPPNGALGALHAQSQSGYGVDHSMIV